MSPYRRASWIAAFLLVACDAAREQKLPLPVVDTKPQVLHDSEKIRAYVESFPFDAYEPHELAGVGQFYLDHGLDAVKKTILEGRPWEEAVVALLEEHARPGSVVLDVGAHIGTHSLTMARLVGPTGRVYAFEPVKKLYRELVQNLRLNRADNVVALRYAVGVGPARVMHMSPVTDARESGAHLGPGGDAVELRSLDSFAFEQVSLIKIDVEGFELFVLDGAEETIRRNRPVLILEIMGGYTYESAPAKVRTQIDITRWKVQGMGYRLERVSNHDYLAVPEG